MANITGFPVNVLLAATDPDGAIVTVRKTVDLWPTLTPVQQSQVQRLYDGITAALTGRYGAALLGLEGLAPIPVAAVPEP